MNEETDFLDLNQKQKMFHIWPNNLTPKKELRLLYQIKQGWFC